MEYLFHKGDLFEEYFKANSISFEDLDTSLYEEKINDSHLELFKERLLSLRDKKFLIVGDYDCDGICSTAIIKRLFEHLEVQHNFYIPSRSKDGYGLNEDIVKTAKDNGFEVIFTVDNGIAADAALRRAQEMDIKVMILDHHEYLKEPVCYAYIHPSLLERPYRKLSAGGLSYLFSTLFYEDELSLVYGGMAVLADMVGVLGYNRYLIRKTLEILNRGGIYQIDLLNGSKKYNYNSLSFNVIPKINAVSRMEYNPNILVKYLLADEKDCRESVASIEAVNKERKEKTEVLFRKAYREIDRDHRIVIVYGEEYKEGLCGLLANRLIHTLNRPVLVFYLKDGVLKGSGRSVEGFDLFAYLNGCKDIFSSFGGHEQACGLSLNEEDLPRLIEYIDNTEIEIKAPLKDIYEMDVDDLTYDLSLKLDDLKPFGVDLEEPLLLIRDVKYVNKMIMAGKYPKYVLNDSLSAISFKSENIDREFTSLSGHLRKDNYKRDTASFIIEDLLNL